MEPNPQHHDAYTQERSTQRLADVSETLVGLFGAVKGGDVEAESERVLVFIDFGFLYEW